MTVLVLGMPIAHILPTRSTPTDVSGANLHP